MDPRQHCNYYISGNAEIVRAKKQTFIFRPGVLVGPRHELFVNPGEKSDGRVGQRVRERLRLSRLLLEVPPAWKRCA